eukprot:Pompholyxophrys_sp_v1_NODE_168_length_1391_cov_1.406577.p1 type:complete len:173 gc:universal NODE_168_length_1391_cov_1.406577:659-141(-)
MSSVFRILNASSYPDQLAGLTNYLVQDVERVCEHYKNLPNFNNDRAKQDFGAFRRWIWDKKKETKDYSRVVQRDDGDDVVTKEKRPLEVRDIVSDFLKSQMREVFPDWCLVLNVYVACTVSTADCERGFSAMKRVKVPSRNRLSQSTLEQLLYINVNGPELDKMEILAAVKY